MRYALARADSSSAAGLTFCGDRVDRRVEPAQETGEGGKGESRRGARSAIGGALLREEVQREDDIFRVFCKKKHVELLSLPRALGAPSLPVQGPNQRCPHRHVRATTCSSSALAGRHSQILVGDLFPIEVVQKFGAIFVGVQDTHGTQLAIVEDGQLHARRENRRVDVQ